MTEDALPVAGLDVADVIAWHVAAANAPRRARRAALARARSQIKDARNAREHDAAVIAYTRQYHAA